MAFGAMVAHLTVNQGVAGSSPARPANLGSQFHSDGHKDPFLSIEVSVHLFFMDVQSYL